LDLHVQPHRQGSAPILVSKEDVWMSASRIALLLGLALCLTACREPTGTERLLGWRALLPGPASDGSCEFDLTEGRDEAVFTILGGLDEYLGRTIVEEDDRVETFYCNEPELAGWFGTQLDRLAREQELGGTARAERFQDCLTVFRSRPIANRLNSCYRYRMSSDTVVEVSDGLHRRMARASLNPYLFVPAGTGNARVMSSASVDRRRATAYLAGAWARHGRGTRFVFANSSEKSRLIGSLLTALGARDVRLDVTSGFIPATTIVRFDPSEDLRLRLTAVEREVAGSGDPVR
jgi:hypothetical protein